jgi:hypothetical protein|tara:strand:+ start:330 stop:530 length:201 start_codon:yes stop_codon:yes gene_type:complete
LKKYLFGAKKFLKPGGRVFLGFGDFGDIGYLNHLCYKYGFHLKEIENETGKEDVNVRFILYEMIPI